MIVDEFLKLLGERPHKAEEILQDPNCPIAFKMLYLDDFVDDDADEKNCAQ